MQTVEFKNEAGTTLVTLQTEMTLEALIPNVMRLVVYGRATLKSVTITDEGKYEATIKWLGGGT